MFCVLVQWIRDTPRKTASRRDSRTRVHKKPCIVSSRKSRGKGGSFPCATDRDLADAESRPNRSSPDDLERIVYRRIARYLVLRKGV